jgi:Tol biopolymer transport system component
VIYHIRPQGYAGIDSMRIVRVSADGTGDPDTLGVGFIPAVSPDGQFVAFSKSFAEGWSNADVVYRPLTGDRSQTRKLVGAAGLQMDPRIAPGGAFVAYVSSESGDFEIYLTRFPSGEGRWQVSIDGGMWPRWNARGDRLFYARGEALMAVDVTLGTTPVLGRPQLVMERPPLSIPTIASWTDGFDVSGDGEEFLFFRDLQTGTTEHQIVVVQNWFAEFAATK